MSSQTASLNTVTKFKIAEWEQNSYHDSDFYGAVWNPEENDVEIIQIGTTRAGMETPKEWIDSPIINADHSDNARQWFSKRLLERITEEERKAVEEPSYIKRGNQVRLLSNITFNDKKTGDQVKAKKDESGTVIWEGAFGRFYNNGFNRKGRHNIRVGVKFEDGRVIFTGLKNLRLDMEAPDQQSLKKQVSRTVSNLNMASFFGYAWDSVNWLNSK